MLDDVAIRALHYACRAICFDYAAPLLLPYCYAAIRFAAAYAADYLMMFSLLYC